MISLPCLEIWYLHTPVVKKNILDNLVEKKSLYFLLGYILMSNMCAMSQTAGVVGPAFQSNTLILSLKEVLYSWPLSDVILVILQ